MSAEVEQMAYAGEVPWHRMGTKLEGVVNSKEMVVAAGLDWLVERRKIQVTAGNHDHPIAIDEAAATVRVIDDKVLGIVTPNYQVFQNHEAFAFLDGLLADGILTYETAGSLFGGKRIWLLARLAEDIEVGVGDYVEQYQQYMLLSTGHDGEHAIHITPTNVRVVCNNTATMALNQAKGGANFFKIRHNQKMHENLHSAHEALRLTTAENRRMATYLEKIATQQISDTAVLKIEADLFGSILDNESDHTFNNRSGFRDIWHEESALNGPNGYSMFQTITGFADHKIKYNDQPNKSVRNTRSKDERRFMGSLLEGRGMTFKRQGIESLNGVMV